MSADSGTLGLSIDFPPEMLEALAERVAEILAERQPITEDGWLRGADAIAAYIDAPPSRVYALASARRIPVHRDGSALVARRSELDAWVRAGEGYDHDPSSPLTGEGGRHKKRATSTRSMPCPSGRGAAQSAKPRATGRGRSTKEAEPLVTVANSNANQKEVHP